MEIQANPRRRSRGGRSARDGKRGTAERNAHTTRGLLAASIVLGALATLAIGVALRAANGAEASRGDVTSAAEARPRATAWRVAPDGAHPNPPMWTLRGLAHAFAGATDATRAAADGPAQADLDRAWLDGGDAGMALAGDTLQTPDPAEAESISLAWESEATLPDESRRLLFQYERAIADLAIDGRVEDADCRQSVCRVSMWFGSGEEAMRFRIQAGEHREGTEIRIDALEEWPALDGELRMESFIPVR